MPDDAIERARGIGIQVAAELPDGTPPSLYSAVAGAAKRGAMLAFASQQAPEGWRPIDKAKRGQLGTFWIASIDADEGGWYKFGSVAKTDPLLCILDDDDRGYWPHENGGYATHFQPVSAPPAMLDAAPSVTLGEVG